MPGCGGTLLIHSMVAERSFSYLPGGGCEGVVGRRSLGIYDVCAKGPSSVAWKFKSWDADATNVDAAVAQTPVKPCTIVLIAGPGRQPQQKAEGCCCFDDGARLFIPINPPFGPPNGTVRLHGEGGPHACIYMADRVLPKCCLFLGKTWGRPGWNGPLVATS